MRTEMEKRLKTDVPSLDSEVKTTVIQSLIWPGYYEVRCFCANGNVYSAMFDEDDHQVTDFILAPVKENK